MTRTEHMKWAKERALEFVDSGDLQQAFSSIASDLQKHPETQGHLGLSIGIRQLSAGHLGTKEQMHEFITGFN